MLIKAFVSPNPWGDGGGEGVCPGSQVGPVFFLLLLVSDHASLDRGKVSTFPKDRGPMSPCLSLGVSGRELPASTASPYRGRAGEGAGSSCVFSVFGFFPLIHPFIQSSGENSCLLDYSDLWEWKV